MSNISLNNSNNILHNFSSYANPTVNDDTNDGYSVGSWWWNVIEHTLWQAEAVNVGAAIWRKIWPVLVGDVPSITQFISSRGMNLFTNGFLSLLSNYGLIGSTFDPIQAYAGMGSFKSQAIGTHELPGQDIIFVDPNKALKCIFWAKSTANCLLFAGIIPLDADLNSMQSWHYLIYPGSQITTLAAPLNYGDTTITLTDATGWHNGSIDYMAQIAFYPYTSALGHEYPVYTYTRKTSFDYFPSNLGIWANGGIVGNVITLKTPWTGPNFVRYTPVANCKAGGSAIWGFCTGENVPSTWTRYTGTITGLDTDHAPGSSEFPQGTAAIRVSFLTNVGAANGEYTWFSAIWLSELTEENL